MELHEQHEYLCEILAKLVPVLNCEELEFLAHCCGERVENFYYTEEYREELRRAA